MTKFRQPARLRELRRIAARLKANEREHETILCARNALLIADQAADDRSPVNALTDACGLDAGSIRRIAPARAISNCAPTTTIARTRARTP